jgi:itaconyl-CoA hydratase
MAEFRSYITISDRCYREHFGLNYNQFKAGQKFLHRPGLTVTQQDNKDEALDTINHAQLHYDQHYAEQTEWKQCLGVSTMTLQKVIGMTSKTFARKQRILCFDDISMTHPVFGGDTLYSESEILDTSDYPDDEKAGLLTVKTQGRNQHGDIVATVTYKMLVCKDAVNYDGVEDEKFASHSLCDDGSLMEQVGIYYEDLIPGETYEHRPGKTFSAEENRLHALRSLELGPQYSDAFYNERHHDSKTLINESFLVGVVTALSTRTFDRVVANLGWRNIQLPKPVYAGDTIYATSTILDKRESHSRPTQGIMHVKTEAYNQKNELVCSYERHFLIYKKGLGPYAAAGY